MARDNLPALVIRLRAVLQKAVIAHGFGLRAGAASAWLLDGEKTTRFGTHGLRPCGFRGFIFGSVGSYFGGGGLGYHHDVS